MFDFLLKTKRIKNICERVEALGNFKVSSVQGTSGNRPSSNYFVKIQYPDSKQIKLSKDDAERLANLLHQAIGDTLQHYVEALRREIRAELGDVPDVDIKAPIREIDLDN